MGVIAAVTKAMSPHHMQTRAEVMNLSSALFTREFQSACINAAPSTAVITIADNSSPSPSQKRHTRPKAPLRLAPVRTFSAPDFEAPEPSAARLRKSGKLGI